MKLDTVSAQARQFHRHAAQYKARIETHPDHAGQFRLSLPDVQNDLAVVDVSRGGMGLSTGFFVPKNLRLTLHVWGVTGEGEYRTEDLTVSVVVRRCIMVDHKPTYQVGVQFLDPSGAEEMRLVEAVVGVGKGDAQTAVMGEVGAT
ncbi:MAG TPA: PilZ domain-containing protein [Phycisphaerae bacterium]|nr:PilZ domain-containing protein [Phycisphaerae bacterium]